MPRDKLTVADMAEEYGYAVKFFRSDPELWNLIKRATARNWSRERYIKELQDSKWYQNHAASWREAEARRTMDPASWKQEVEIQGQKIQQMAADFSVGKPHSRRALRRLAARSIKLNWSDDQLRNVLAKRVRPGKDGHYGGELGAIEDEVRRVAYNNGIHVSRKSMRNWMRRITRGTATMEDYEGHIRKQAQNTWKAFAPDIKAGNDLIDLADPYITSMREILELPAGKVDLFAPKVRNALSQRDDQGNHVPMNLAEWEERLRRDVRWKHTRNAQETASEAAFTMLNQMGFRA